MKQIELLMPIETVERSIEAKYDLESVVIENVEYDEFSQMLSFHAVIEEDELSGYHILDLNQSIDEDLAEEIF